MRLLNVNFFTKFKLLIIFLAAFTCGFSQSNTFSKLINYYSTKNFNGAVLVATGGKIDFLTGAGIANRQSGTTINSKSKFKIASITKTFTAVLIMQLQEQGRLSLTDKIGKYLSDYKGEAKYKVSIYDLLTYSSGLPNCEHDKGMEIYQFQLSPDAFISKYSSDSLEAAPGTKFNYDNGDYIILGRLIEKITGKSYAENLQQKILAPAGMLNTGLLTSGDIINGLANSYTYNDSTRTFSNDAPYFIENFYSAGAMYSTVEDLLKFDQGIFTYKLLKKSSVDEMIKPVATLGNVGLGFWYTGGYGKIKTPYVYRPGGILGSSANWIHVLDSNRTIIVLSNTDAVNLFEMSQQFYSVFKGAVPDSLLIEKKVVSGRKLEDVKGIWTLDLRPGPNSAPYLKDFIIEPSADNGFSGEFYGSRFTNGHFNTDWDQTYFAFTTSDNTNTYYHSGYINGDTISGVSYSPERKFTSHWTGVKKK